MDAAALKAIKILEWPIQSITDSVAAENALIELSAEASQSVSEIIDDAVEILGLVAPGEDCPGLLTDAQWQASRSQLAERLRAF